MKSNSILPAWKPSLPEQTHSSEHCLAWYLLTPAFQPRPLSVLTRHPPWGRAVVATATQLWRWESNDQWPLGLEGRGDPPFPAQPQQVEWTSSLICLVCSALYSFLSGSLVRGRGGEGQQRMRWRADRPPTCSPVGTHLSFSSL